METPTFSTGTTILTIVRDETGIGSSPVSSALQNTAMLRAINDVNAWFVNYPYTIGMLGWKFLKRETIIESIASTTISGAHSSGATTVTLTSGTNWDDPGGTGVAAGYVKSGSNIFDFFTYEDRSSNSLTTASGLQEAHSDLEEAHKIYQLPTDYGKPRALFRESNTHVYQHLDEDFRQVPPSGYFMTKYLTSTNNYSRSFLIFPEDIGALNWKLYYMKSPTTIDEVGDSIDAPDGIPRRALVEKVKEYVYNVLMQEAEAQAARTRAEMHIRDAVSAWATHTLQVSQNLSLAW